MSDEAKLPEVAEPKTPAPTKKVPPKSKPKPKTVSGMVPTLNRAASGVRSQQKAERSFYLVEIRAIFDLASRVDRHIRRQSRRGNWKHVGYYAGIVFRLIAAKLQRVGEVTNQLAVNSEDRISVNGLQFIACIVHLVDQFGTKNESANNVDTAPRVTPNLILHLLTISEALLNNQHVDHATCLLANNHKGYQVYGRITQQNVFLAIVAGRLSVSYTYQSDWTRLGYTEACMLAEHRLRSNLAVPTPQQFDAARVLQNGETQLSVHSVPGGIQAGPGGIVTAAFAGAMNVTMGYIVPAANPLPGGLLAAPSLAREPFELDDFLHEVVEVGRRYTLRQASVAPTGSFAPLVSASDVSGDVYGSSPVIGLTPTEWVLGCVLNHHSVFCTRSLHVFNVHDRLSRNHRNSCPGLGYSVSELQSMMLNESFRTSATEKQ